MTAPLSEFTVQKMYFTESISIRRQKSVLSLIKCSCHSKTEQTKEMKMKIIAGTTDFTIEENDSSCHRQIRWNPQGT